MNLLKSKKGVFKDVGAIIMFLTSFGIVILFGFLFMYNFMNDTYLNQLLAATGVAAAAALPAKFLAVYVMLDNIFLLILIALTIGLIIISRKVATRKVFFVINFIMMPILGFISWTFNFIFSEIAFTSAFDVARGFFPKTLLICTNLHWIALFLFVLGSISMYGKRDGVQQGGEIVGGEFS